MRYRILISGILILVALVILLIGSIQCGPDLGAVSFGGTYEAAEPPPPPPLPQTSMRAVRIYGPKALPEIFEIIPHYGSQIIHWSDLKGFRREGMRKIDLVVKVKLEDCTDENGVIRVEYAQVIKGGRSAGRSVVQYIENRIEGWRYTPYKTGIIYLRIDEGQNMFVYDDMHLISCDPDKDVPVGQLYELKRSPYSVKIRSGPIM